MTRIAISIVSVPPLAVIVLNVETFAERLGWHTLFADAIGGYWPAFVSWATQPLIAVLAVAAVTFFVGMWFDNVLMLLDGRYKSRKDQLTQLGEQLLALGPYASRALELGSLRSKEEIHQLGSALVPIFISLSKQGFHVPGQQGDQSIEASLRLTANYCNYVGSLLAAGHHEEARDHAAQITQSLTPIAPNTR